MHKLKQRSIIFGDDYMIIRIRKIHILILAVAIISVSLLFALKSEPIVKISSSQNEIKLPVVMYHHITQKSSRAGKYVVLDTELANDIDYLKKCGYRCVTVSELIDFVEGKISLDKKIVMITFDDGFESVYKLAWPILKEKEMKAVVSPVGAFTETYSQNGDKNVNYAYMSWDELKELDESEEFEVQNHTYNMHFSQKGSRKGLSRMNGESDEAYTEALKNDLTKMQDELKKHSSITTTAVVYPYGVYSNSTLEIIKDLNYKCSMVCEERINIIRPGEKDCLYNLGRFNRPSGISSEKFFERLGINDND